MSVSRRYLLFSTSLTATLRFWNFLLWSSNNSAFSSMSSRFSTEERARRTELDITSFTWSTFT